jgi:hypothetical protein
MKTLNAEQFKKLQRVVWMSRSDFDYAMEPVAAEMRKAGIGKATVIAVLRAAAQRAFYLTATDAAFALGVESFPEYADATGKVRAYVDQQAATFAQELAA